VKPKHKLIPKEMSAPVMVSEPDDIVDGDDDRDEDEPVQDRFGAKPKRSLGHILSSVPLASNVQEGDYSAQLTLIRDVYSDRSGHASIRADLDIGQGQKVEAVWIVCSKEGETNSIAVQRFRQDMAVLGYEETETERFDDETLEQVFDEINQEKPRVRIRVNMNGTWQNVRFLSLAE
jgi:hypothetical protein